MKKIEELKSEEWQMFLDMIVKDSSFTQTIMNDVAWEYNGVEYTYEQENEKISDFIPFYDPELLLKLYENKIDITVPLEQLKIFYKNVDNTNSLLFEYAMEVNRIINIYEKSNEHQEKIDEIAEIKKLNKIIIKR